MNRISILNPPLSIINPLTFKGKFNLKMLWILSILIGLSLLIVLVIQFNTYTKEIYLIQDYEQNLNQLTKENKILEINFFKANSLRNIGNYIQSQVFEKAEQVDYIRILEGTVLAK